METQDSIESLILDLSNVHIIKGAQIETDYSTSPPSKIDNWSKVQSIQHEQFIYIQWNGSPWSLTTLDDLFDRLDNYSLDPDRSYITVDPCEGVRDDTKEGWETVWIDGPRLYEADGVISFNGNFIEYSHGYSIYTNYEPLIQILSTKMAESLARPIRYAVQEDNQLRRQELNSKMNSVIISKPQSTKSQGLSLEDI